MGCDNDPCPRCGGHGLDNNGARAWNPEWRWILEAVLPADERVVSLIACNSLDECRLWSADFQTHTRCETMAAICLQTGEVVSMEVFK